MEDCVVVISYNFQVVFPVNNVILNSSHAMNYNIFEFTRQLMPSGRTDELFISSWFLFKILTAKHNW
jgi:hypothetical protein